MGTLGGHLLPGSIFILFAIRWSFNTALLFSRSKMKTPYIKREKINNSRISKLMRRFPIESITKASLSAIGILGEVITGLHRIERPIYQYSTSIKMMPIQGMNHSHFKIHQMFNSVEQSPEITITWSFLVGNGILQNF